MYTIVCTFCFLLTQVRRKIHEYETTSSYVRSVCHIARRNSTFPPLDLQIAACTKYAVEKGYCITQTYQEIASGLASDNPALAACVHAAKNGAFTTLFISDYARLSRSCPVLDAILMQFAEIGVTVISITEPYPALILEQIANCIKQAITTRTRRNKTTRKSKTTNAHNH